MGSDKNGFDRFSLLDKSDRLGVSEKNGDFQKEAGRKFDEKRV